MCIVRDVACCTDESNCMLRAQIKPLNKYAGHFIMVRMENCEPCYLLCSYGALPTISLIVFELHTYNINAHIPIYNYKFTHISASW